MARPATNHETKKTEILAAALKSFAHYGYEGTTTKTIAEEGGFKSPALIYHYFPGGKFELFLACFDLFEPLQRFAQMVAAANDLPPELFFRNLVKTYLELVQDELAYQLLRMIINELPRIPELKEIFPQKIAPLIALPTFQYLSKLMAQGRLRPQNPLILILELFGPLFIRVFLFGAVEDKIPFAMPSDQELIETVVTAFLRANLIEPTQE